MSDLWTLEETSEAEFKQLTHLFNLNKLRFFLGDNGPALSLDQLAQRLTRLDSSLDYGAAKQKALDIINKNVDKKIESPFCSLSPFYQVIKVNDLASLNGEPKYMLAAHYTVKKCNGTGSAYSH